MVTTTETRPADAPASPGDRLDRVPAQRSPGGSARAPGQRPAGTRAAPVRIHAIDGLRFLAAFGVVVYHYTALWSTVWGEDPADRFPTLGSVALYFSVGPELFFVVSGFVVLWTAWGRSIPQIVSSRVARVFPAYWTALALTSALLLAVWPAGKRITPGEVAVNVTLLQEPLGVRNVDGVYWTLWAELRFYLLIAVLAAIGITRRRVVAFAVAWPLAAVVADAAGWHLASDVLISRYAPFFAGGMLLFLIHRDGHARLLWALVAGNATLGVLTNLHVKAGELEAATTFTPDRPLLAGALLACFGLVAVAAVTPLRRIDVPWLATAGSLTYPLYLVHLLWGWWFIEQVQRSLPTAVTLVAAIAFALVLAALVHAVERRTNPPLRRALQRLLEGAGGGLSRLRVAVGLRARTEVPEPGGMPVSR